MWFEIGSFFGQQNLTVEKLGLVLTFFQQKKEQFLTHCIKEDKSHLIKYPLQTEALCLNYNYKYIVRHLSVKHVSFTTQQTVNRHCIITVLYRHCIHCIIMVATQATLQNMRSYVIKKVNHNTQYIYCNTCNRNKTHESPPPPPLEKSKHFSQGNIFSSPKKSDLDIVTSKG